MQSFKSNQTQVNIENPFRNLDQIKFISNNYTAPSSFSNSYLRDLTAKMARPLDNKGKLLSVQENIQLEFR